MPIVRSPTSLPSRQWDVVVCGGGLSGLSVARHLQLDGLASSILVVEEFVGENPAAAFKVGESMIEPSANYFATRLKLRDHLEEKHLEKFGLRFFFPGPGPFHTRPEVGLRYSDPVRSYQVDRGTIENELRRLISEDGAWVCQGSRVMDIDISGTDAPNAVHFEDLESEAMATAASTWVIDATGRRRVLHKKLDLSRPAGCGCCAAWFRVKGDIDLDTFVPPEETDWHRRVPGAERRFSTNHLMGDGRWVWIIPLGGGFTSIGIVARHDVIPISTFDTHPKAMAWLRKNEPELALVLEDCPPLDFLTLRNYAYSAGQVYSSDRWACVGDAGVFSDPLFSPGMDTISIANSIVGELIRRHAENSLSEEFLSYCNEYIIAFNDAAINLTQPAYPWFGQGNAIGTKFAWNLVVGWALNPPQRFNYTFINDSLRDRFRQASAKLRGLALRMESFFLEWAKHPETRTRFALLDYASIPGVTELYARSVCEAADVEHIIGAQAENLAFFECLAQAIFRIAAIDTGLIDQLDRMASGAQWLNLNALSLRPDDWEKDGLFRPASPARDFGPQYEFLKGLYVDLPGDDPVSPDIRGRTELAERFALAAECVDE